MNSTSIILRNSSVALWLPAFNIFILKSPAQYINLLSSFKFEHKLSISLLKEPISVPGRSMKWNTDNILWMIINNFSCHNFTVSSSGTISFRTLNFKLFFMYMPTTYALCNYVPPWIANCSKAVKLYNAMLHHIKTQHTTHTWSVWNDMYRIISEAQRIIEMCMRNAAQWVGGKWMSGKYRFFSKTMGAHRWFDYPV